MYVQSENTSWGQVSLSDFLRASKSHVDSALDYVAEHFGEITAILLHKVESDEFRKVTEDVLNEVLKLLS